VKAIILLVLLVIIGSLGSALYYLIKDRNRSPRTVKALTLRIALSIGLFFLLLLAYGTGLLQPHGLRIQQSGPSSPPAASAKQDTP
jgi:small neutral amino acid transporter SnatA (MarC family)